MIKKPPNKLKRIMLILPSWIILSTPWKIPTNIATSMKGVATTNIVENGKLKRSSQ